MNVEDYREYYNQYFKEFNRLAVGDLAELSYAGKDTPNDTCSSLESVIAYANFINDPDALILNAGAGASSWMLRKLFKNVTCIDPNPYYLDFIQYICKKNGLSIDRFYKGFVSYEVDHVYFDYGNIERLPYLGSAIDLARKSVYVDDVDTRPCCFPYRDITIQLCDALGLKWMDCPESLDSYGRAGIIILK